MHVENSPEMQSYFDDQLRVTIGKLVEMFATAIRDDDLEEAKAIRRMPEFREQLDAMFGTEATAKAATEEEHAKRKTTGSKKNSRHSF
jgi:hypothetical protein